jgi:uncharacterized repeat protein (TIGR02543 family)/LPXTG-motif cell wall-anchored protein
MKKRSLLLLGVITLGWVQPVCTVVAEKMETTIQSYSAVMDKSLKDSALPMVGSQPNTKEKTNESPPQERVTETETTESSNITSSSIKNSSIGQSTTNSSSIKDSASATYGNTFFSSATEKKHIEEAKSTTTEDKQALSDASIIVNRENFGSYFTNLGTATYDPSTGVAVLTEPKEEQVGAFTLNSKLSFNTSFSFKGALNLGTDKNGADGLGFAFHQGNTTDIGFAGNGLGITGLQNAIGFKADTYYNIPGAPESDEDDIYISRPSESAQYGGPGDIEQAPYGAFVTTNFEKIMNQAGTKEVTRWWPTFSDPKKLSKDDIDGNFHDFSIVYDAATRKLTVSFTQSSGNTQTWERSIDTDYTTAAFTILGSTGLAFNKQQVRFDEFSFQEAATVNVKYVDTNKKEIAQGEVTYPQGAYVNGIYTTEKKVIPGYTFKEMDPSGLDSTGNLTVSGSNGTVTYIYDVNKYTVKYDANGGRNTDAMPDQSFLYDQSQNLSDNLFIRPGYTFKNWDDLAKGGGNSYTDKQNVKNLVSEANGTVTLYAQWTANEQNVNFDANGGSTDQKTITGKTDETVDLSEVKPASRAGYSFKGWYTSKTGDTKMPANVKLADGGVTYYAQWTANEQSVNFDANGGSTDQKTITGKTDETVDLSEVKPASRVGYTFKGWYTSKTGDTKMPANVKLADGGVTYYAQWTANEQSVNFDANGGSTDQKTITGKTDETVDLSEVKPASRVGYTFKGWYTSKTGDTKMPANVKLADGGVTYYAQWTANEQNVNFDANGGSTDQKTITGKTDETVDLSEVKPASRAGYSFKGWYTSKTGDTKMPANVKLADGGVTYYAQWTANEQNVNFDANGGSTDQKTITGKTDETVDLSEVKPASRAGYSFKGWYTSKTGDTKMPANVKLADGGVTYYAQWTANEQSVNFDANGGSTDQKTITGKTDETVDLSEVKPASRVGYTFKGWYTSKTGDTKMPANVKLADGGVTYYAQWTANEQNVNFDANGGSTDQKTITGKTDETVDLSEVKPASRAGYSFKGWYTSKTGDTKMPANVKLADGGVTYYAQWTANEQNVNFDANGGSTDQKTITGKTDETVDLSEVKPASRAGYSFKGWYTSKTGDTKMPANVKLADGGVTYYAQWTANEQNVNFDANGGSTDQKTITGKTDETVDLSEVKPASRVGYTFKGWYTSKTGDTKMPANVKLADGGVTYYAQWTANEQNVNFDANGGSTDQKTITGKTDETVDLSEVKPASRAGYSFKGWYTSKTGDTKMPANVKLADGGVTYYAQWTANEQNVNFDANGGSTDQKTITGKTDETVDLSEVKPASRVGYTFKGWYTSKTGDTKMPANVKLADGGVTYYAQWTANEQNVNFDANGGSTDQKTITGKTDETVDLSEVKPASRAGYSFKGWYTSKTGDTKMPANVKLADGGVTYYAQWTANEQNVNFDANGGSTDQKTITGKTDETVDLSEVKPASRAGYSFKGWYTSKTGDTKMPANVKLADGGVTYYAQWTANEQNVNFDANGGSTDQKTITGKTDETVDLSEVKPASRAGYSFKGWYTSKTGDTKMPANVKLADGGVTYYAQWTANEQNVNFDANGGSTDQKTITGKTDETVDLSEVKPASRAGYSFKGWYTSKTGDTKMPANVKLADGGVTYYAQWTANEQNVNFDANGGSTDQKTITGKTDETVDLSEVKPASRVGYTFKGWYTSKTGDTKMPANVKLADGGVTYYAQWTANEQSVNFDANGGSTDQKTITGKTDETVDLSEVKPASRVGYTFKGWYTSKTGDTKMPANVKLADGGVTYYAQWTANEQNVNFDANGGSTDQKTITGKTDETVDLSEVKPASRAGYSFKGWYTSKTGDTKMPANVKLADGGVTYYAQWTANEQNVNFDANGGSTDQKTITGKTDETVDLSEVKPASRAGYSFKGWYTSKTGDTKMPANVKLADGGVTYYAQWTANEQNVNFDANGKNKDNSNTQSGQAEPINGSKPNLPNTGEQRENIFYILGGVIVFLAIALYVLSKKNRRNK